MAAYSKSILRFQFDSGPDLDLFLNGRTTNDR